MLILNAHSKKIVQFAEHLSKDTMKTAAVLDYDHTMGGMGRVKQVLSSYFVPRKQKKIYYKNTFQHVPDEETFNAFVLYQRKGAKAKA